MNKPIKSQRALKNRTKKIIWKIFKGLLVLLKILDFIQRFFDEDS